MSWGFSFGGGFRGRRLLGGGGASSLYTIDDFAYVSGDVQGDEKISATSMRLARLSGQAMPLFQIADAGINGAKVITCDFTDYDIGGRGITFKRVQLLDGAALIADLTTAGPKTIPHTFTSGTLLIRANTEGRGGLLTAFNMAAG